MSVSDYIQLEFCLVFFLVCFHTVFVQLTDTFLYLREQHFFRKNRKALNYVITTLHHVYSWIIIEVYMPSNGLVVTDTHFAVWHFFLTVVFG